MFTFVRVRRERSPCERGGSWSTDTPDSDLNFSYRLQQMTSIKVDPNGRFLRLTDSDLSDYPFIYMVEPGSLLLNDEEVVALRKYLLNGGFLMLDDFWGEREWAVMEREIKRFFPTAISPSCPGPPIYHCVFEIKTKGQVPGIRSREGRAGRHFRTLGFTRGASSRHLRRQGPHDDDRHAQHRQRRRLGARGESPQYFGSFPRRSRIRSASTSFLRDDSLTASPTNN